MASFGATGCNTTRARCGMVSQAIIILSYFPTRRALFLYGNLLQASFAVDADAVFPRAMTEAQSSSGSLPSSFPSLTDCICSYPMMNFTLAIWQLPFPCFCRIQYYFEIASFPPLQSARVRAQVRSGGILCPSSAGQEAIRPTVAAAGLRAFDEKVGLPKFAHSLLASFHTVS